MSWLKKSLGVVSVGVVASLAATGCEQNESMLFVVGVLNVQNSGCVARAEQDAVLLSGGTLDVALRGSYRAALLVGSHLTQRGSREQLRTETARFVLQGAEITLTDLNGRALGGGTNPYSTVGTGFINPASGTEAGFGAMFVELIPPNFPLADGMILAKVRAFGETLGGAVVESNEFSFPIQICNGCLISYPSSSAADDQGAGAPYLCRTVTSGESGAPAVTACFPGQDAVIPCDACSALNNICRDPCSNCAARPFLTNCTGPAPDNCAL